MTRKEAVKKLTDYLKEHNLEYHICLEEGCCDIVITTIIPYDFWEVAPLETADYLTAYCPELLDGLTYDIFGVLIGKITADEAIRSIKRDMFAAWYFGHFHEDTEVECEEIK